MSDSKELFEFWMIVVVVLVLVILVKAFVYDEIGLKPIKLELDRFYFTNRGKAIKFEQIEKIDLRFERSRTSTESARQVYCYTNLEITLNNKKKIILHETTHRDSFWVLINACRNYNETAVRKIILTLVVPKTEHDLILLMDGWSRQNKKVLSKINRLLIEDFALQNNISYSVAKKRVKLMRVTFIIGFFIILFFAVILLILFYGTTFHIG